MKKGDKFKKILKGLHHYFSFFLLVAFVVTCCMLLFLSTFSKTLGITFTDENIGAAAKLTFVNVIIVSALFTLIDELRRKWVVERPVRRITEATDKMMKGDFSVRIPTVSKFIGDDTFNEIIRAVNKMAEELSSVETFRSDFVANVSHEIKTPLSVIQNYAKLLQSDELTEEKRMEYAASVADASRRLADMVTNVLKLNRLENQKIFPKKEEYDLSEQLCACLLQYESVWEKRNIQIQTDLQEGVTLCADEELLFLVWNNLLSNAFKFTEENGTIRVTLFADEAHAVVTVADTGCGMTAEVGAHIFEKFYQGDPSRATQGNGLGLALVKRVVDIMRGEISVQSVVGKGTEFTVKIGRK